MSVIFYNFYFTDVVSKFADKDTTLVQSQENIEDNVVEPPFFTFWMQLRANKSYLDGYKLSTGVLNEPNHNNVKTIVSFNKTFFREVTFKINVAFELDIRLCYYENDDG